MALLFQTEYQKLDTARLQGQAAVDSGIRLRNARKYPKSGPAPTLMQMSLPYRVVFSLLAVALAAAAPAHGSAMSPTLISTAFAQKSAIQTTIKGVVFELTSDRSCDRVRAPGHAGYQRPREYGISVRRTRPSDCGERPRQGSALRVMGTNCKRATRPCRC